MTREVPKVQLAKTSHGQQAIWFLQVLAPESAAYHVVSALRLRSEVKLESLRRVFQALVDRHPQLRTTFSTEAGEPVQQIQQQMEVSINEEESSEWSAQELEERLGAEARRKFSLTEGPLMRVKLYRRGAEGVLLVVLHHIVVDLWSLGVMMQELGVLYEAELKGAVAQLEPLTVSYSDYVKWQEEMLVSEEGERQRKYWEAQLAQCLPVLNLPTDRPRYSVPNLQHGATESIRFPVRLARELKSLAEKSGTTLYVVLLAAFYVLLYRYTGHDDLIVGSPTAGRGRAEWMRVVGYFVNPVALRTRISGDWTFRQFLSHVRETVLAGLAHQDYPFALLVKQLQLQRDSTRPPLFQVMFVLQNKRLPLEFGSLGCELLNVARHAAQFDLTFTVSELHDDLELTVEYNVELFESATIQRMMRHFEILLDDVVSHPAQRVANLRLLTEGERRELKEWTTVESYETSSLTKLFEAQVERTPDAVALVCERVQLSYAELNERANQLAHYLRRLGVGPEVLVGVCLERSLELMVSVLAVLKAGGAYVPMEPGYPRARVSLLLEGVSVLLTQSQLVTQLPIGEALQVVRVDEEWPLISSERKENPESGVGPENLAYVIYTSGSTGWPKGVMVTHGNVARLFAAVGSSLVPRGVWALFHSVAFDFSVWEMWGGWLSDGRVVVVPESSRRDAGELYELLKREGVTVLSQTPTAFAQLVREVRENRGGVTQELVLREVVFGGEALAVKGIEEWLDGSQRLVNMYGLTEATVHATVHEVQPADLGREAEGSVIGRSLGDLRIYLLGAGGEPVPVGVVGELYVGGTGLARGYLGQAALTAERFIPDGLSGEAGARLYQTGDLGRRLASGELEYLGRADQQVKIRGYRVEPAEIEVALSQHPAVRECIVLAQDVPGTGKQLVAYLVGTSSTSELRSFLKHRLPEYMIPAAFVCLDSFPLTPNGKIDQRALPAPTHNRPALQQTFVAPQLPAEQVLADVWSEVLAVEQIGIHDNFFELGGDSIRSIMVVSRAKERGLRLSIQQLFQLQTIYELARVVEFSEPAIETSTQPFSLIQSEDRVRLPDDVEDAYPLTSLQLGMLFHSEYTPDTPVYHDIFSVHLRAPFDGPTFGSALEQLAAFHPALRTSFDLSSFSEPMQLVHRHVAVPFEVESICDLSRSAQEETLAAWIDREKRQPIRWSHAPLLRVHVHQRSRETFQLTFSFHHAVLDGWSLASMVTELLNRCFGSAIDDGSRPTATFRDFVALEREAARSEDCNNFWQQKVSECERTSLPRWLFSRATKSAGRVRVTDIPLGPLVVDGLKELARTMRVPLKSVLLAAHLRVLSLLAGRSEVVTGVVFNGREEERGGENVLGLFLNTLPFGVKLPRGSWSDLIRETFRLEQEILPFRRYPLAQLDSAPLFDAAFNYTHFHVYQRLAKVSALEVLDYEFFEETNFVLLANFILDPFSSSILLRLSSDANELCDEQIDAIRGYYERALSAMSAEPHALYDNCSLLSEKERRELKEWTTVESYETSSLTKLFEAQVERTPDAVALVCERVQLSYAELNERANQLAHYLRRLGVGPEVLVGVCLERSLELMVSVLAVLKAGGSYVPMEPGYPRARVSLLLEGVSVLLTQSQLVAQLPIGEALQVVRVDEDWPLISSERKENPESGVGPENLAYVIYTSGSTGWPKGVMVTHGNVARLFAAVGSSLVPRGVWALFHSVAFDFSVWEMWGGWLSGGCVVVVPESSRRDAGELYELLKREGVTVLSQTPTAFAQLVREVRENRGGVTQELALREVVFGGEALAVKGIEEWLDGNRRLVNMYGLTEATVHATVHEVQPADLVREVEGSVIGRSLGDLRIYLLGAGGEPVPVGVVGELYVGGAGLARGYLGQAALTAERFIPDGLSGEAGARLYQTGDLGRRLASGELKYLGRADQQVKIRGYRVEPAEIEVALSQHPAVRECTVVVADSVTGRRLVAYVVGTEFSLLELRKYLLSRLPEYMIPSAFVRLAKIPLTSNNKLDRRALPDPDEFYVRERNDPSGPITLYEELVLGLFRETLKIKNALVTDNFFELGGNSLLATQLISRARKIFSLELPLRILFEHPTVAAFAHCIESELGTYSTAVAPPVKLIRTNEARRLSFAQEGLWFLDQLQPANSSYNISAAVKIVGQLNVEVLEQCLNEIVRRHEILRTTFVVEDDTPVQVVNAFQRFTIPVINPGKRGVGRLAAEEARRPFELAQGPLLRVRLLRLADDEHVVLFTMHHIIGDGWSLGVLVKEVAALYDAYIKGETSPLPELELQYADYAAWQREWLQGTVLEEQLSYWRRQLGGELPVLELPADRRRPAVQSYRGARKSITFSEDLTQQLQALSQREGCTLFMTLLAAFQVLLHRYTRQDDIVVGTVVAGRTRVEVEPLIGLFINSLVLRTDLSGDPTFVELLRRVREVTLGAYAHQDVPFEKLVEELQPERAVGRAPLFQVAFGLQNAPLDELRLGDAQLSAVEFEQEAVRFDLTVWMTERDGVLSGVWTYSSELFDAERIAQMQRHYAQLLQSIVEGPVTRISNLTAGDFRWDASESLAELFARQAERDPDAVAVVSGDETVSYGELNERANQLGHYLQSLGVGPEHVVGLCLERSVEQVLALLGVLKAGGAYLPLEPSYPEARLRYMLEEAGVQVVLTHGAVSVPSGAWTVVRVDEEWEQIAAQRRDNPESGVRAENLAYVLYTSGTTGRPKGVMIRQSAVVNLWRALGERVYGEERRRRVSVNAPLSFDASVKQWVRLLSGDTLCVVPEAVRVDGEQLLAWLSGARVEVLDCTPGQLRLLLGAGLLASEWQPEMVLVGGEAIEEQLWQELSGGSVKYYNVYGPTECTVDASCALVSGARPVLGRVLGNVRAYVLDEWGEVAATGVRGELYLGGAGVARGYLGQAALTAERFVPDALSGRYGERLYRTGDECRYESSGELAYVGRVDEQVKVRGYRIELGEIAAVLEEHEGVAEAVVAVREAAPGDQRLVAYVVGRGEVQRGGVRRHRLPNGLAVAEQNRNETEYLYEEIFGQRSYLRGGVELGAGACVFDVGANIGMFTLFAAQESAGARIYAFEPVAEIYEDLRRNAGWYVERVEEWSEGSNGNGHRNGNGGGWVKLFATGLSDHEGEEEFSYYRRYSMMSGQRAYAAEGEEREVIDGYLRNEVALGKTGAAELLAAAGELLEGRFAAELRRCRVRRLSAVMQAEGVEWIDLLKVDVQRAELDVLRGVDEEDWQRIGQVVMEVHDREGGHGRVREVVALLERQGFTATVMQEANLQGTDRYNVYAVSAAERARRAAGVDPWSAQSIAGEGAGAATEGRPYNHPGTGLKAEWDEEQLRTELRRHLRERLPAYMVPSALVLLPRLPLTRHGKVDRHALPAPENSNADHFAPRSEMERTIAHIWSEALNVDSVGIDQNFFDLGGHSLLLVKVHRRLKETLNCELSLMDMFRYPTIKSLAQHLNGDSEEKSFQHIHERLQKRDAARIQNR